MPDQKRLKLLVITMMYEPDCVGIAAIATDMCAALAQRGHEVTVYTTYSYYPEWKLKSKAPWRVQKEKMDGVQVKRHRIFVPSDPSRLFSRLIHELSFPVSLGRSLFRREEFDVVMAFCPLMGGVVFAGLRKLFFRDPLWLNIQDIPVEAASASGMIRSSWLARLASGVQKFVFNRADVWSTISPDMVRKLETIRSSDVPICFCPNWLTKSLYDEILQVSANGRRIPQGPTKFLYSGTIGNKQGLLQFCQSLSKSNCDFQFQIRGAGSAAESVRRWVESSGDRRFEFDGLLSQTEFVHAVHSADWFVIPQKSSAGGAFFPSKLIPSMFIGTPILAISENDGPLYHEVSENGLGLVVPWSQVDRLMNELDAIHRDPARYTELQTNCVRRAEAYERESAIDKFESMLMQLSSPNKVQSEKKLSTEIRSDDRVPIA